MIRIVAITFTFLLLGNMTAAEVPPQPIPATAKLLASFLCRPTVEDWPGLCTTYQDEKGRYWQLRLFEKRSGWDKKIFFAAPALGQEPQFHEVPASDQ